MYGTSVRPSNGPRSDAAMYTWLWPVYASAEPKPPSSALGTQLAGFPAWQILPVRPDLSSATPGTRRLPISVIPTGGAAPRVEPNRVTTARAIPRILFIVSILLVKLSWALGKLAAWR